MSLEMKTIRVIPHRTKSAAWQLALEEALYVKAREKLRQGQSFSRTIRLYSFSKPSVVLGNQQRISEIDFDYCQQQGVDVTMRKTGGGSVYLGAGDLQYSLIIPEKYTLPLLRNINQRIIHAFQDIGFNPDLVKNNNHDVIRLGGRGFVFDAQRRGFVWGVNKSDPTRHVLLHHGTILINNDDYDHMPSALRATRNEITQLETGNVWLENESEVKQQNLIRALQKNLEPGERIAIQDYTGDELRLAKQFHNDFYNKPEAFSDGKKATGICYKTSKDSYDMELYAEEDKG
jgi:lipoate-protein ligase A